MTLSPGQIEALRNLARKKAGAAVGWISIPEACRLADLGFAVRNPGGWTITAAGEAALELPADEAEPPATGVLVPFHPRAAPSGD